MKNASMKSFYDLAILNLELKEAQKTFFEHPARYHSILDDIRLILNKLNIINLNVVILPEDFPNADFFEDYLKKSLNVNINSIDNQQYLNLHSCLNRFAIDWAIKPVITFTENLNQAINNLLNFVDSKFHTKFSYITI